MADEYPEIFVLRHGQTEWNRDGRYQGSLDSPLTELGRIQAATQGEILRVQDVIGRGFRVFSSPQGRTQQTADIICEIAGGRHTSDPRLKELLQGDWEGLSEGEIAKNWPQAYAKRDQGIIWYFDNPTGETYPQIYSRSRAFLQSLTEPAVIVTHGVTSHVLRGVWLGLDLEETAALPGGQGCVYHLREGRQVRLTG